MTRNSETMIKKRQFTTRKYPLKVDYKQEPEPIIKFGGKQWKDENVSSRELADGNGNGKKGIKDITIEVIKFNKSFISNSEVFLSLYKKYRPVELTELLKLGEEYPELQEKFCIVSVQDRSDMPPATHWLIHRGSLK